MLGNNEVQLIQDLKLEGLTPKEIADYFEQHGMKRPTRQTISKYYKMDVVPENLGANLVKDKAFDAEPFKSTIIAVLEVNSGRKYCLSSVYDVLQEKFVEFGDYECLPGNAQTLRNYVHYLEDSGQVNLKEDHRRTYDYVFDTPPGEQMLIDFGQVTISKNNSIFFICLLLRYSRMLCVYAQDHRFNAMEACQAIYLSFRRLGGRPKELVIDQDPVFVENEELGEVVKTATFTDFCTEQDVATWVCRKHDPESKGPILSEDYFYPHTSRKAL